MSEKRAFGSPMDAILGQLGPGAALGYSTGREAAGQTAAMVAPTGRKLRSEAIARKLGVPASVVGALGAMYLANKHKGRIVGEIGKLLPAMDPGTMEAIGKYVVPAMAGLGGGAAAGTATGGLVGGVARLRGAKGKTAALQAALVKMAKKDMPDFTKQDRPKKVKEIYRALKRDHPGMPAEMKARIAARQGKPGKQKQGPPYKGPLTKKGGAMVPNMQTFKDELLKIAAAGSLWGGAKGEDWADKAMLARQALEQELKAQQAGQMSDMPPGPGGEANVLQPKTAALAQALVNVKVANGELDKKAGIAALKALGTGAKSLLGGTGRALGQAAKGGVTGVQRGLAQGQGLGGALMRGAKGAGGRLGAMTAAQKAVAAGGAGLGAGYMAG